MPYTGYNDPKLPPHVKALAKALRQKWVKVFNSTFKNCRSPNIGAAGSVAKCETAALKFADGAVKTKEIAMTADDKLTASPPDDESTENGKKCSDLAPMYEKPVYFGGATSFDDVDKYREAQEFDHNISDQKWTFDQVFDNIMAQPTEDVSLEQKLAQVKSAVDEFAARSEDPPEKSKEAEGLLGQAVGAAKRLLGSGGRDDAPERIGYSTFAGGGLMVTRDKETDVPRWVAIVTNKFKDRENEIFSEVSHQEFTEWVDRTKEYSALRLVHVPGSDIGHEDFTAYTDGFVISSGVFAEGMDDVVESLAASKEALKISHGYYYNVKDFRDGVYSKYRRFEISIVPAKTAANSWTEIEFTGEALRKEVLNMPLTDEKRAFLIEHLGEERTSKIEEGVEAMAKDLEGSGVGFKELAEVLAGTKEEAPAGESAADTAKPPDEKPDEKPDETPAATTEGDDDPSKDDPPAVTKELAPLAAFIGAAVAEAVKPLQEQVAEITGQVKELTKSDDEKVDAKMASKTQTPAATGNRPTDDKGNVIDAKEAAKKGATDDEPTEPESAKRARVYAEMMTGADRLPSG